MSCDRASIQDSARDRGARFPAYRSGGRWEPHRWMARPRCSILGAESRSTGSRGRVAWPSRDAANGLLRRRAMGAASRAQVAGASGKHSKPRRVCVVPARSSTKARSCTVLGCPDGSNRASLCSRVCVRCASAVPAQRVYPERERVESGSIAFRCSRDEVCAAPHASGPNECAVGRVLVSVGAR